MVEIYNKNIDVGHNMHASLSLHVMSYIFSIPKSRLE